MHFVIMIYGCNVRPFEARVSTALSLEVGLLRWMGRLLLVLGRFLARLGRWFGGLAAC